MSLSADEATQQSEKRAVSNRIVENAVHKVAVLHSAVPDGAPKDELDVIVQTQEISQALDTLGYLPVSVPFSLDLTSTRDSLTALAPLLVVNLVETVEGKGRFIYLAPALLDAMGIPYTGCPTEAVFLSSNKILAKRLMAAHGVATPPLFIIDDRHAERAEVEGRYIIKSVWEHASIGMDASSVVTVSGVEDLANKIARRRLDLGGQAFAEAYVEGREFNIALLEGEAGPEVLPPAEILFDAYPSEKPRIVDYAAKWEERSFEFHHTPRSFEFPRHDAALLGRLCTTALDCWRIFGLRGYARVDFRVDAAGLPWVLEVNTNPCLSSDAGFIAAAARVGLRIEDVVTRLVRAAIGPKANPKE